MAPVTELDKSQEQSEFQQAAQNSLKTFQKEASGGESSSMAEARAASIASGNTPLANQLNDARGIHHEPAPEHVDEDNLLVDPNSFDAQEPLPDFSGIPISKLTEAQQMATAIAESKKTAHAAALAKEKAKAEAFSENAPRLPGIFNEIQERQKTQPDSEGGLRSFVEKLAPILEVNNQLLDAENNVQQNLISSALAFNTGICTSSSQDREENKDRALGFIREASDNYKKAIILDIERNNLQAPLVESPHLLNPIVVDFAVGVGTGLLGVLKGLDGLVQQLCGHRVIIKQLASPAYNEEQRQQLIQMKDEHEARSAEFAKQVGVGIADFACGLGNVLGGAIVGAHGIAKEPFSTQDCQEKQAALQLQQEGVEQFKKGMHQVVPYSSSIVDNFQSMSSKEFGEKAVPAALEFIATVGTLGLLGGIVKNVLHAAKGGVQKGLLVGAEAAGKAKGIPPVGQPVKVYEYVNGQVVARIEEALPKMKPAQAAVLGSHSPSVAPPMPTAAKAINKGKAVERMTSDHVVPAQILAQPVAPKIPVLTSGKSPALSPITAVTNALKPTAQAIVQKEIVRTGNQLANTSANGALDSARISNPSAPAPAIMATVNQALDHLAGFSAEGSVPVAPRPIPTPPALALNSTPRPIASAKAYFPAENTEQVARNIMPAQAEVPFPEPVRAAFNAPASSSRAAQFANKSTNAKPKVVSIEDTSFKNMDWGERKLTEVGRQKPVPLESGELSKVLEWEDYRNKFLKKLSEKDISDLLEKSRAAIEGIKNNIRDHFTPDDIAALFKENKGVKIYDDKGILQNHFKEYNEAVAGVSNGLDRLKKRLDYLEEKTVKRTSGIKEKEFLREFVKETNELLKTYTNTIEN